MDAAKFDESVALGHVFSNMRYRLDFKRIDRMPCNLVYRHRPSHPPFRRFKEKFAVMNKGTGRTVAIVSAVAALSADVYCTWLRSRPEVFSQELSALFVIAPFYLWPFFLFTVRIAGKSSDLAAVVGCVVMAVADVWLFLAEAFSKEPSWGFSLLMAAGANTLLFLLFTLLLWLSRGERSHDA